MDLQLIGWWCTSFFFFFLLSFLYLRRRSKTTLPPPPGPAPWPVVGNLFSLGEKPHKSLAQLAETHGPLFSLRLGSLTTVVISSHSVVREIMQNHDAAFAGRDVPDTVTALGHHEASVVFLPPCARWRFLRKICISHVFSTARLDAGRDLRREKMRQFTTHIEKSSTTGNAINIGHLTFTTMLNILSNTFFSVDLTDLSSEFGSEFRKLVWDMMVAAGTPNIADFFPVLKLVDPQGRRKHSAALAVRMFKVFDDIIDMRLKVREESGSGEDNDVLDSLLTISQKGDAGFGRNDILHLLLDLFAAGTDTSSSTTEWAMTELLRNPEKLKRAQEELEEVVGRESPLEESHLAQLPYLQAIIKETLRIHPPIPFLVPRRVETDVELCGYTVPKNAQVFVNIWAMGRDEKTWKNATSFEPERFLESSMDHKGHDPELVPFGFGRRVCPGLPLASRMLAMILGSLIHSFDWKLEGGMRASELDMDDKFGFTLQRAKPLCLVPILR